MGTTVGLGLGFEGAGQRGIASSNWIPSSCSWLLQHTPRFCTPSENTRQRERKTHSEDLMNQVSLQKVQLVSQLLCRITSVTEFITLSLFPTGRRNTALRQPFVYDDSGIARANTTDLVGEKLVGLHVPLKALSPGALAASLSPPAPAWVQIKIFLDPLL